MLTQSGFFTIFTGSLILDCLFTNDKSDDGILYLQCLLWLLRELQTDIRLPGPFRLCLVAVITPHASPRMFPLCDTVDVSVAIVHLR